MYHTFVPKLAPWSAHPTCPVKLCWWFDDLDVFFSQTAACNFIAIHSECELFERREICGACLLLSSTMILLGGGLVFYFDWRTFVIQYSNPPKKTNDFLNITSWFTTSSDLPDRDFWMFWVKGPPVESHSFHTIGDGSSTQLGFMYPWNKDLLLVKGGMSLSPI